MKYRTILIDDEPLALQRLGRLLKPHQGVIEIIDVADNGQEAVEKIDAQIPDLIFLDIQMPEMNGFDVLNSIQHQPLVIFSTAYDEYALKAFEADSIDYLLKPVDPKRLKRAIEKLFRLRQDEVNDFNERLQKFLSTFSQRTSKRLEVRTGNRIRLLNFQDIYFFRAADKYVEVHTFDEDFLITKSLSQLEKEVPAEDFVRIHRSALINLNHLNDIVKLSSGAHRARMQNKNKTQLPISRTSQGKIFRK